jgi:hypothetical protein
MESTLWADSSGSQWFSNLSVHQNHLEELFKSQIGWASPPPPSPRMEPKLAFLTSSQVVLTLPNHQPCTPVVAANHK